MYKIKQVHEDFIVEEVPNFHDEPGEYTYFSLKKRNMNTEDCIQSLSKLTGIRRKNFGYAGNKDKNAITMQYCSVKGRIRDYEGKDFAVRIVGRGSKPISLGDLASNKFTITVRNIRKRPKPVDSFINYFDDQRFGNNNVGIGLAILKKDFRGAVELCDYVTAQGADYVGALRKVPHKILKLYIHSVQSWLWNEVAADLLRGSDAISVKYGQGLFVFPKTAPANIEIPIVSFDTVFEDERVRSLYTEKLKMAGISLNDFVIRSIPSLTPAGGVRVMVAAASDLDIGELQDDELNEGMKKIKISFILPKGSYATVLIKALSEDFA